jgi:hypothetical protein
LLRKAMEGMDHLGFMPSLVFPLKALLSRALYIL